MANPSATSSGAFRRPASRVVRSGGFFGFAYRVASPTEWLYKTGSGAKEGVIAKKALQQPFQQVAYIDISPVNYHFDVHSMSSEMVPFQLPMVFTVGPVDPRVDMEGFRVYCNRLSTLSRDEIKQIVEGVIQGEVRVLSANMTIRQMFSGRDGFRANITDHVQKDLVPMGLKIYNANIAELSDLDAKNRYFENLKMKALEGANTEARVQVAEARNRGDIGEAEKRADTATRKAAIEADVTQKNNMRNQAVVESNADLAVKTSKQNQRQREAQVDADTAVRQRQVELETLLARKQGDQRREVLRSTQLAEAGVEAESRVRRAEGEALAVVKQAEAKAAVVRLGAEATLFQELKRAEGVRKLAEAQAAGVAAILAATGGDADLAKFYIGVEKGLFTDLAAQTAAAIHGLQPKINVWNTGAQGEGGGDFMGAIRNLFTGMPPMLDALAQQTNVQLPSFMPQQAKTAA